MCGSIGTCVLLLLVAVPVTMVTQLANIWDQISHRKYMGASASVFSNNLQYNISLPQFHPTSTNFISKCVTYKSVCVIVCVSIKTAYWLLCYHSESHANIRRLWYQNECYVSKISIMITYWGYANMLRVVLPCWGCASKIDLMITYWEFCKHNEYQANIFSIMLAFWGLC